MTSTHKAVRHDVMRARNLAVVLGEIDRSGPLSRAALAERTGLTKTTVSKLVADLIDGGMVVETGAVRGGERGRPGVAVQVHGGRVAALGLEIGIDYLAGCVVDLTRTVRLRRRLPADNRSAPPEEVIARLGGLGDALVREAAGLGLVVVEAELAIPGPIDPGSSLVHYAPNLGWRDVALAELLQVPVPVRVDNEANLAALGELWFGAGAALGNFLHISGEIGIGAGVVVGGRLFRGAHGFAGELGHVVVVPDGDECRCGVRGCLERYAGQDVLLGDAPDLAALTARLAAGDPAASATCRSAGEALGIALTSAVHLLDPDTIVLGGVFGELFPWLSGPVGETMASRLRRFRGAVPELIASKVGPDAAILGAAGSVIMRIIADPAAFLSSAAPPA